jgi:hypothetical protein
LETIQVLIDDIIDTLSSPVIEGLKRFFDKYMVLFAESRAGNLPGDIELDLRCLSCNDEIMAYYIDNFKDKFDVAKYFCIFADGEEDELFIKEFMTRSSTAPVALVNIGWIGHHNVTTSDLTCVTVIDVPTSWIPNDLNGEIIEVNTSDIQEVEKNPLTDRLFVCIGWDDNISERALDAITYVKNMTTQEEQVHGGCVWEYLPCSEWKHTKIACVVVGLQEQQ